MRNIYNAKNYVEEILMKTNSSGMGFINESAHGYFQKAYSFSGGYDSNADYSGEVISVGLLNDNILEIGINLKTATHDYCQCLKNDVCRKLLVPHTHLRILPKQTYYSHLNLNAGNKIAHHNLAASSRWGTLGAFLLPDKLGGTMYVLSNNHVLADSNRAQNGDSIYYMEGAPIRIGKLKNFTPISSSRPNILDLAVAEIPGFVDNGLIPSGSRNTFVGENVYKIGARTQTTYGVVRSIHYTAKINFGEFDAVFTDQIQITAPLPTFVFSQPGDSGSLIRSRNDHSFLGLLFAGNGQWTLANHQVDVISKLKTWGYNIG